jgi:hypothetical protein
MLPEPKEGNSDARNGGLFTTNSPHALTRGIRSLAFELADERRRKVSLNAGNSALKGGV